MNVLIVEDEDAAARRLKKLISEVDPTMNVLGRLDSIEAVLNWLARNELPELIFLDIHLADGSSFEIFKHVEVDKPIIFTTAYDQYAIRAFEVNAIDYLLKPIKKENLKKAIEKFRRWEKPPHLNYSELVRALEKETSNQRFLIRLGHTIRLVEFKGVAYFYTEDKITFLVTKKGKRYPVDYSLEKLEEMTNPRSFFRINRQFIINIEAIKEMYAYSKSRVKIELEPSCNLETIVSTERSPHFKKWLTGSEE